MNNIIHSRTDSLGGESLQPHRPLPIARWSAMTVIVLLCTVSAALICIDYAHFPYSDGAEHAAAVCALTENLLQPPDPMLPRPPTGSARFVPSIVLMALFMRACNLSIQVTIKISLLAGLCLFCCAAFLFGTAYFGQRRCGTGLLLTTLFLWGTGWTGANAYMFSALLYTAYFPSVVAFSLSLLALYYQQRFHVSRKMWHLVVQFCCVVAACVNHPVTGGFCLVGTLLFYYEYRHAAKYALIAFPCLVTLVVLALACWPYYNFFGTLYTLINGDINRSYDYIKSHNYLYSAVLPRLAPAGIGLLCAWQLFRSRGALLPLWGACGFLLLYALGFLCHLPFAARGVFFMAFCLQLAAAPYLTTSAACRDGARVFRACRIGVCTAFVVGAAIQLVLVYTQYLKPAFSLSPRFPYAIYASPTAPLQHLASCLDRNDIVFSDRFTSWGIPAFTGARIVALMHTPPHVTDNSARINDTETFFALRTTPEERQRLLHKYHATHLLFDERHTPDHGALIHNLKGINLVAHSGPFWLYCIKTPNGHTAFRSYVPR